MKDIKAVLCCGLMLAFAGCVNDGGGGMTHSHAVVRAIHGTAQYTSGDGQWHRLGWNMVLSEGATVQTGEDSTVDLQVNGRTSTVRMKAHTTMTLKTMEFLGKWYEGKTVTMLDLKVGTLLGSVKKISKDSRFEISTPRGVARVLGNDFAVEVADQKVGYKASAEDREHLISICGVTFTCGTGRLEVVANLVLSGTSRHATKILESGQAWTPPIGDFETGIASEPMAVFAEYPPGGIDNIAVPNPPTAAFFLPPTTSSSYIGGSKESVIPAPIRDPLPEPAPVPIPVGPHPGPGPNPVGGVGSNARH